MLNDLEKKLLANPPKEFPLLQAVAAAEKACPRCGHPKANVHLMLRTAITKYRSDKNFQRYCASLFPLPVSIAGLLISKES